MSFEDYLKEKKIDASLFKSNEPDRWHEWNTIFIEVSPASFTAQKLYLINPIRRKYPLKSQTIQTPEKPNPISTTSSDQKPAAAKPVFRPKMK
jgi:hypothetical protein